MNLRIAAEASFSNIRATAHAKIQTCFTILVWWVKPKLWYSGPD